MDKPIILNVIRCLHCGDEVESLHRHDYCGCSCGEVAADGGRVYLRRRGVPGIDYEELSVFEEE